MVELSDLVSVAQGLDHPEGVAAGLDGMLYAGGEAGQIYRVDPAAGTFEQIASTEGFVLGVCLDADGVVYACDAGRGAVLRVDPRTEAIDVYCEGAGGN